MSELTWTVFTKPWPDDDAEQLAQRVAALGFDGIELPVRAGYPVSPANAAAMLPRWAELFADAGLTIASVAGNPVPELFDACAAAGISVIRTMVPITGGDLPAGTAAAQAWLKRCVSSSEATGVRMAVQQHHGRYISTSDGLSALLRGLPATAVGAAWDAGHSALAGEEVDLGFSTVADRLIMVNLKNAFYERADVGSWIPRWVAARDGMSDWRRVAQKVRTVSFTGTICLSAQYTQPRPDIDSLVRDDLAYAHEVFG